MCSTRSFFITCLHRLCLNFLTFCVMSTTLHLLISSINNVFHQLCFISSYYTCISSRTCSPRVFCNIFTIMSSFHNVSTSCSLSFLLHVHTISTFLPWPSVCYGAMSTIPHLLISSTHNVLYQFSFISSYYMSPSSSISSPHIFCTIYHVFNHFIMSQTNSPPS